MIKQFIEDAVEGRWKYGGDIKRVSWNDEKELLYCWIHTESQAYTLYFAQILLDPKAWQAVGKTRGWLPKGYRRGGSVTVRPEWHARMRWFIDHLANGLSIDEALELIK